MRLAIRCEWIRSISATGEKSIYVVGIMVDQTCDMIWMASVDLFNWGKHYLCGGKNDSALQQHTNNNWVANGLGRGFIG